MIGWVVSVYGLQLALTPTATPPPFKVLPRSSAPKSYYTRSPNEPTYRKNHPKLGRDKTPVWDDAKAAAARAQSDLEELAFLFNASSANPDRVQEQLPTWTEVVLRTVVPSPS